MIIKRSKSGSKVCTRCNELLAKDHVGKRICRSCLDGKGIDARCDKCGVDFKATARSRSTRKYNCPKCQRKSTKNQLLANETPPPEGQELSAAARELASRALARKYLWAFVLRHDPKYMVGWFHRDLSARLEKFIKQVENKESPRLMIQVPPRHGKSRLASQEFPAWLLGHHPEWEIIAASYAVSLPVDFSRNIRERLRDEVYKATFPSTSLHPESQSVESWRTTKGGGFLAAGVGGPITGKGAHCFPAGTRITTDSGSTNIEDMRVGMSVFTCDISSGKMAYRPIEAIDTHVSEHRLIEITTATGQRVRATPDHCFYVPTVGWVEAADLCEGDKVIFAGSPNPLRCVSDSGDEGACRSPQSAQVGVHAGRMRQTVRGDSAAQDMPDVPEEIRPGDAVKERPVLLECLHTLYASIDPQQNMPELRDHVQAEEPSNSILPPSLRECSPFSSDARGWELPLQRREQLRAVVRFNAPSDYREGCWVRCLRDVSGRPHSSHRPRPEEQFGDELDLSLPNPPHGSPQVVVDTVSMVAVVGEPGERVYDIQVAGTRCFFAEHLLVHNCLIIDDPIKNAEEAESQTTRNGIWNWYTSTAYTRLAPGGGILIIQTRWHSDDLSGRIEQQMRDEDGEPWEIVRYPAIALEDERYRKAGEALHQERYDISSLERIKKAVGPRTWNALYMQNPVPDEGAYFTRSMFRTYEKPPELLEVYNTWDLAVGQKQQNDWSVGVKWGVDPDDNIYILDVLRGRFDAAELTEHMLDMWKSHPRTQACGIEEGQIKLTMGPFLEKRVKERRMHNFHHIPLKPGRQDKVARARTLQGRMRQGQVFFPEGVSWMDKLVDELLSFPFGKHDDQVDSLAYAALMAAEVTPPQIESSAAIDTSVKWKQKLLGYVKNGTRGKSWMAA